MTLTSMGYVLDHIDDGHMCREGNEDDEHGMCAQCEAAWHEEAAHYRGLYTPEPEKKESQLGMLEDFYGVSKITESARNEECQIRIPGVCLYTTETVVWCHANGSAAGKGIGMKSHDLLGSYGCSTCHDAYDRRIFTPGFRREEVEVMFWEGHARSLVRLIEKGIIVQERGKTRVAA